MPVNLPAPGRYSYLLRLQRQADPPHGWRIALQDIRTGEWYHFTDLDKLFAYLAYQPPDKPPATTPWPPHAPGEAADS
jgi:hypothetical protein